MGLVYDCISSNKNYIHIIIFYVTWDTNHCSSAIQDGHYFCMFDVVSKILPEAERLSASGNLLPNHMKGITKSSTTLAHPRESLKFV